MKSYILLVLLFHLSCIKSIAQTPFCQIQAQIQFGKPTCSIGFSTIFGIQHSYFQLYIQSRSTFFTADLGNRYSFLEHKTSLGTMIGLPQKNLSLTDHQFQRDLRYSNFSKGINYCYIWYVDTKKTSQRSGFFGVLVDNFLVEFENDLFAGQGKDRFRTGHIRLIYQYKGLNYKVGVKCWTGETKHAKKGEIQTKKVPFGYSDLSDLPYGKTSHGIIYGGFGFWVQGNYFQTESGIDSEGIRHFFQNKVSHDLYFLPKHIERKTPQYPKLDINGYPTFYSNSIRAPRFYTNLSINFHDLY